MKRLAFVFMIAAVAAAMWLDSKVPVECHVSITCPVEASNGR